MNYTSYTWEEAMDWYMSSPASNEIREAATELLLSNGFESVGSSDINHEVYSMYSHYLSYIKYLESSDEEFSWDEFLRDVTADIK